MGSADADVQSTLAGLAELAGWLAEAGVTLVGIEATGVYWKIVVPSARGPLRMLALERRTTCATFPAAIAT